MSTPLRLFEQSQKNECQVNLKHSVLKRINIDVVLLMCSDIFMISCYHSVESSIYYRCKIKTNISRSLNELALSSTLVLTANV